MTAPDVSAVVVAWNSGDSLVACADSLRDAASRADARLQLVVVDNASDDDAVERIELTAADVLVRNPVNGGYGLAASQGLARAEAPWALLANPDLVVSPTFFEHLLAAARSAPESVAALVPEMRYAARPDVVNCRGITMDEAGIPAEIDAGKRAVAADGPCEPLGGSSGCCLLRIEAVRSLGGLELAYFAYLEDVDLAARLARAGYGARLVPAAVSWHQGSASAGPTSPLKTFLVARNRRILFRLEAPSTLGARLARLPVELGHGLVSSTFSSVTAPWRGRLDAVRLHRYTAFVHRARTTYDDRSTRPRLTRRATLLETLRRKRTVAGAAVEHADRASERVPTNGWAVSDEGRIDSEPPSANTG
jgi:N-acetylglucosaminyl-diphospho-decaprenol L-rhamnosyltransferase